MTTTTDSYLRTAEHERLAAQVNAFLANGGTIEHIPRGAMVTAGWAPAQRLNRATVHRQAIEIAERAARKAATKALPVPRREPPAPKVPFERFAPEGSQKRRILDLLAHGPLAARELAQAIGTKRQVVAVHMADLRKRGLVQRQGSQRHARYSLCP